jgi:ketosteroid isomerase-like protein
MTSPAIDAPQTTTRAASPLERFLRVFDRLDPDACAELFAADGRLRFADGRVEQGRAPVRECLRSYFADLRSTEHRVIEPWHLDRVCICEVEARYVLADASRLGPVSKVFVARTRDGAIEDLRVYAAGEPSFHEALMRHENERLRGDLVRGRWIPPL